MSPGGGLGGEQACESFFVSNFDKMGSVSKSDSSSFSMIGRNGISDAFDADALATWSGGESTGNKATKEKALEFQN
jgi:DNA topoisomerase IB